MSSKTAPSRPRRGWGHLRPWTGSIVVRLTAWYASSALVLVLVATGFLYWVLATSFDAEDRRTLANTVTDLRLLLRASGDLRLPKASAPETPLAFRQPQEIWVRVLDVDGRTVLETPGMGRELPALAFPQTPTAGAGRPGADGEVSSSSGRLFQTLSVSVSDDPARPDGRTLQVAMDRADEAALLVHYREWLWAVLTAALVLCAGTGYAIARRGVRPIRRITTAARRVRSSTLHERIDAGGLPSELRSMADTFNEMLDRLEASFAQISQFSADVAHELRTPVNNLRGEIEVALGKARSVDEYRDTLGSALEECLRLSRVIQSLLFLARTETAVGAPHNDIEVRQEIRAVLDFYEATAAEAGVELAAEEDSPLVAPFDRTLFQQAIGNLVANAIAHTPLGGRITVRAWRDGPWLRVEVADTGCGIAAEHLPHVLNRFYRVDRARSGSAGNLGLGLSMVSSIAALHGGQVVVGSEVGRGTCVRMETPLVGISAQIEARPAVA